MNVEERLARVEQAFVTLTELAVRADERMDSHDRSFNELDTKIAALTDAQIKTEAVLAKLAETQERTDVRLAEMQERTDAKLVKLAEAQERTDAALARLAQAQERTDAKLAETDARLNRLADIVERHISGGRDGQ